MLSLFRGRAVQSSRNGRVWLCASCRRAYSDTTAVEPPALLVKLRSDLKTAMRAKDTERLNVLRAILAEVTNAAKLNTPYNTDMQLVSLLKKRSKAAKEAGRTFVSAGRADLSAKEEAQAQIMDGYASGVDMMSEDDIRQVVKEAILEMRSQDPSLKAGIVMKTLLAPGGRMNGQPVDKALLAGVVKETLAIE